MTHGQITSSPTTYNKDNPFIVTNTDYTVHGSVYDTSKCSGLLAQDYGTNKELVVVGNVLALGL